MIESGVTGFFERGGYMLSEDGTQHFYGGYAVVACGDVAAFGNRGGGFDECQGISGQVAIGTPGLVLMEFATSLSAEIIREAMDAEGLNGL